MCLVAVAGSGRTQLAGTRLERNASASTEQILLGAPDLQHLVCGRLAIELVRVKERGSTVGHFADAVPVSDEISAVVARDGEHE